MVGRIIVGWFIIAYCVCCFFGNYLKENFPKKESENKYLAGLPLLSKIVLYLLTFPLVLIFQLCQWLFGDKDGN